MYKIGIIGTENSHAQKFAEYFNVPGEDGKYNEEDMRVTAILGTDQAANAKIVATTGVEYVAETVEDLLDRVDAVMITCRRGSEHMPYALPCIEKKIPMFIDKPFTSDPAEADALMAKLLEAGTPVMGGSACKYLPQVQDIKATVAEMRAAGEFVSASMSFRVMLDSEYDGIYFYSPHLVEMCLEIFGFDIKNVQAMRTGDSLQVNVQYEKDAVALQFVGKGKPSGVIYSRAKNQHFDIDISGLHVAEAGKFARLVRGEEGSLRPEQFTKPVYMIAAIKEAMETGKIVSME